MSITQSIRRRLVKVPEYLTFFTFTFVPRSKPRRATAYSVLIFNSTASFVLPLPP